MMVEGPALADLWQAVTQGNGFDALLIGLHLAERAVLTGLDGLGLVDVVHGQPAWPWASRIDSDNLVIDRGHARQVAAAVLAALVLPLLVLLGALWRRLRWPVWGLALFLAAVTPWPDARVLLTAAHPTSFHRSPSGYTARSIVAGAAVYQTHCQACHGAEAVGDGPQTRTLARLPPSLIGPLLWRRTDGELFWRVRHGMVDRTGRPTMPGFAGPLGDEEVWAVLDYLKANAAGQGLRRSGEWPMPVALPDLPVDCRDGRHRSLRSWPGRWLLVVATDGDAPMPDPRFTTVALRTAAAAPVGPGDPRWPQQVDCISRDEDARQVFAWIAGVRAADLEGTQFLTDRRGWLRARAVPGQLAWSADDLLCRSGDFTLPTTPARPGVGQAGPIAADLIGTGLDKADIDKIDVDRTDIDGADIEGIGVEGVGVDGRPVTRSAIDALLTRMEAQPVRLVRGGVPH